MANNRLDQVVSTIVEKVRDGVREEKVSYEEYRAAVGYMMKVADAGELALFIDLFLNATMCRVINENAHSKASLQDMEGPYFLDESPMLEDGKMKLMDGYENDEPLIVRGTVRDVDGAAMPGVLVDMWNATPDGKYGGIHEGVPVDHYRGKVRTDENGHFRFESTVPVPYRIKDNGPVGAMLKAMGRHSWRPAHVHIKVRHEGYRDLITQLYFAEGEYVHDDCCEGTVPQEFVFDKVIEDGKRVLETDLFIEKVSEKQAA
ncbi:catechol 1,2-dioxygenase [Parasphingorhabdus marina DSM 22363]|uniref:Catechol 1,2-dioxygenase n=1 Tax=Parasphingorhabdus marina DSM 22363 TaxID=1123272 RepID=A0A1N6D9T2_9SPHN|nr:dioxygenase [Parasphingorhabdus marina]SIN67545.1 catechol 1,2-dioxygenase [Parasphingorhabdus marina DSM 22363]